MVKIGSSIPDSGKKVPQFWIMYSYFWRIVQYDEIRELKLLVKPYFFREPLILSWSKSEIFSTLRYDRSFGTSILLKTMCTVYILHLLPPHYQAHRRLVGRRGAAVIVAVA